MTSLFQVIAHEDNNDRTVVRQAMALSLERVEDRFGMFVRKGSVDDQAARFSLVEEDVRAVVAAACEQVSYADVDAIYAAIAKNFVTADATPQLRTASVRHEARKPKMCPYHSEVTDISLTAGEPQAGFNAMAQHAWGPKHCQGEGYEGDKCKFKPAMTTQAYWDERSEKLEQKREERAERERQEALQAEQNVTELETVPENPDVPPTAEQADSVEQSAPSDVLHDGFEGAPAEEIPMAMAAATKEGYSGPAMMPAAQNPQADHIEQARRLAEYYRSIGDEANAMKYEAMIPGGVQQMASTKTAEGTPEPKMDKRKWTPKTVGPIDTEGEDSPHPTKRKDVIDPITVDNKGELSEIGENKTERQDVTEKGGIDRDPSQGGTFGGGERSAVSGLLSTSAVKDALSKLKRD